jgi:phosphoglycerol transferase MdoB-like AlkP superfamily enzyme
MLMFLKGKLDKLPQPFLAYAFTGTTHTPYAPLPPPFEVRRPNQPEGINGYLNTLHYSDWAIGQFMRAARQAPWFDNTIFIFTADHATHWQQGGFLQRFHTPFLIYAPGIIPPGTNRVVGSQLDVLPTIIDLLGFDDRFAALGESLFRKRHGYAFVTEGGSVIGLITARGYVTHNLQQRLQAVARHGRVDRHWSELEEHRLLSLDQLSFELLRDNRWAPE